MHTYAHRLGPRPFDWFAMGRGHRRGGGGRRGPAPFGFPDWGGRRGPRARRGDVRAALLALLAEEPRNGYQLMQEIEQRSDGMWRPSPGSVYPALQQLQDEGLVFSTEEEGRRHYDLTEDGRAYVAARSDELAAPWDSVKEDARRGHWELMQLMRQVGMATGQLLHAGTDAQIDEAQRVLGDARRSLYRILAEDEPADEPRDGEA
jgi:DNA-binding PadR family transcriptional regulator